MQKRPALPENHRASGDRRDSTAARGACYRRAMRRREAGPESDPAGPTAAAPIIFLGPSLPVKQAQMLLPNATFRGPIQRGDLEEFDTGALVGIIDGVFAQTLA